MDAAITPHLARVRALAVAINGGYSTADTDLIAGVVDIARAAGWSHDEIAADPEGAIRCFLDVCDYRHDAMGRER